MTEEITKCPICGTNVTRARQNFDNDMWSIDCPRCLHYEISDSAQLATDIRGKITKFKTELSGLVNHYSRQEQHLKILTTNLEELLADPSIPALDDIERKGDLLLRYIRQTTNSFGDLLDMDIRNDASVCFADGHQELAELLRYLRDSGWIEIVSDQWRVKLTALGFQYLRSNHDSRQVFIASWFDDRRDPYIKAMEQVIDNCGLVPRCIKFEHFSDTIMNQALGEIRRSRAVIVDLTGKRLSVAIETGFALGLGIEMIFVYDKTVHPDFDELEFYVKHYQCHGYENTDDLAKYVDSAIRARGIVKEVFK